LIDSIVHVVSDFDAIRLLRLDYIVVEGVVAKDSIQGNVEERKVVERSIDGRMDRDGNFRQVGFINHSTRRGVWVFKNSEIEEVMISLGQ
jgi:hypothetical protein